MYEIKIIYRNNVVKTININKYDLACSKVDDFVVKSNVKRVEVKEVK